MSMPDFVTIVDALHFNFYFGGIEVTRENKNNYYSILLIEDYTDPPLTLLVQTFHLSKNSIFIQCIIRRFFAQLKWLKCFQFKIDFQHHAFI